MKPENEHVAAENEKKDEAFDLPPETTPENSGSAPAGQDGDAGQCSGESQCGEKQSDQKQKKEKSRKKDKKDEQIEELTDRLKRSMAEFDNYRKRTDKEKASMYEFGAKEVVEKILPVVDNFERALASVPEDIKGGSYAEGMEMIYKQFMKTLEDMGVTPIAAVGQEFDPELHNAVMHIEDENFGENIISQELQKGYKYKDHVVRHSMVQVAN